MIREHTILSHLICYTYLFFIAAHIHEREPRCGHVCVCLHTEQNILSLSCVWIKFFPKIFFLLHCIHNKPKIIKNEMFSSVYGSFVGMYWMIHSLIMDEFPDICNKLSCTQRTVSNEWTKQQPGACAILCILIAITTIIVTSQNNKVRSARSFTRKYDEQNPYLNWCYFWA